MRRFLIAMLCAAPLVGAPAAYEGVQPAAPAAESAAPVEVAEAVYMGCDLAGCTDPTHPHSNQCWESTPPAEPMFCPSMGCARQDCTDPAHYHACPADCIETGHYHSCPVGCTDPAHYHDCPVGCTPAAYGHGGYHHSEGRGHHRGRHS